MAQWIKPTYLKRDLPVAVDEATQSTITAFGYPALVATYAGKVNTKEMIALFLRLIPPHVIERFIRKFPDCTACLTKANAGALEETEERYLFALTVIFFKTQDRALKKQLPKHKDAINRDQREKYAIFGLIKGCDLVGGGDPTYRCHDFAVGNSRVLREFLLSGAFFKTRAFLIHELGQHGYKKTDKPAPGQLYVYCCGDTPKHYGRVESVSTDGKVLALSSKKGKGPLANHHPSVTYFQYGQDYLLFDVPFVGTSRGRSRSLLPKSSSLPMVRGDASSHSFHSRDTAAQPTS